MAAGVLQPESIRVPGTPALALLQAGQGELVLFLHGVGGNKFNWAREVRVFSRYFHAVAWDMRGYGESDDYEGPLRFEDLSADILRILAYFGVQQVHLVGLSMGGRIAFDFLHRHPERVRTLTVCSASHRAAEMSPERRAAFLASRLRPLREEGKTPADIAADVARSLVGPHASVEAYEALVESMCMLRAESYMKALEAVSTYEGGIPLESIRVPTNVVAASDDRLIPADVMRPMAQRIPGSVYQEITDCGHLSNLERPYAFERAVLGFLLKHAEAKQGVPVHGGRETAR
ncbi:alpha/beta fold hydrolase [Paraburkholderia susongensis]|uniref:3-oxoadipate enol-lactonase n=1 Tax=Paraburkholderia susongensis TaxID=1515439 RepID=A0A1X7LHM8_9BURK|nr:alpha/beta fold hydrolase [Paraburkholderia susongensis]SMG53004.1 3-oxoadipate enol-lactonase [Paraburkholderia susongensis]